VGRQDGVGFVERADRAEGHRIADVHAGPGEAMGLLLGQGAQVLPADDRQAAEGGVAGATARAAVFLWPGRCCECRVRPGGDQARTRAGGGALFFASSGGPLLLDSGRSGGPGRGSGRNLHSGLAARSSRRGRGHASAWWWAGTIARMRRRHPGGRKPITGSLVAGFGVGRRFGLRGCRGHGGTRFGTRRAG